jgi:uncharacterized Fe-S radical SAM superfamily protein PflX
MIEYIILVAVIAAGVMGIIITKNMFGSNEIHGKLKNRYDAYIADLEKDNKKLTGKLNKMKQGVSISKDDFDEANPLSSIGALISQFAPMLPKNIQPLLQDPQTMKYVEKLVKDNPDKVNELIQKFVKAPKAGKKDEVSDSEVMSV